MRTICWLLPCALLCLPAALAAQTIRGTVLEDGTGEPIAGATVQLVARGGEAVASAQTNEHGAFQVRARRGGRFTLRLRHLGYAAFDSDTLVVASDEALAVVVRMAATAIPIEPLVVTARLNTLLEGFHERRRRGTAGQFLTREEIEKRLGAQASELLRGMRGVQVERIGRSTAQGNVITMRGTRGPCRPTVFVDGMQVPQVIGSGVDDFLTPTMLAGVEVYTSFASVPPPLHSRNGCGVIAFWTHSDAKQPLTARRTAVGFALIAAMVLFAVTGR